MSEAGKKRLSMWGFSLCLGLFLHPASWANEEVEYRESVNKISNQIKIIGDKLNADRALLKTEQEKLAAEEQKISLLNRSLAANATKMTALRQEITRINQQLAAQSKAQEHNKQALAELIRNRYMYGRPHYLKMLLNQENPYAVGRLSNYYDYFAAAQEIKLSQIRVQLAETGETQKLRHGVLEELEQLQQQEERRQQNLNLAKARRGEIVEELNQKVVRSSSQLKVLQQDRERLNRLLAEIAAQAEELRKLEQKKATAERRDPPSAGSVKVTRPLVAGGFLKQRGRLRYPVSGEPKYRFGSRLTKSGMLAQGTFFDTIQPVAVKSIFRGRVLFADYLKGYGLLMIVDHGDDHISLYGHNALLYKKVGDSVETNEILAQTGTSGGLKTPGLYFEIRNNATPVDPSKWCR